jgi:predicted DNA-binding transcriptional regulator AlpA
MTNENPADDEIDIDEAMRITGRSRSTLMRWIREKKLTAHTQLRDFTQRQPRVMFRRSEIESLAGSDEQ